MSLIETRGLRNEVRGAGAATGVRRANQCIGEDLNGGPKWTFSIACPAASSSAIDARLTGSLVQSFVVNSGAARSRSAALVVSASKAQDAARLAGTKVEAGSNHVVLLGIVGCDKPAMLILGEQGGDVQVEEVCAFSQRESGAQARASKAPRCTQATVTSPARRRAAAWPSARIAEANAARGPAAATSRRHPGPSPAAPGSH